jgi:hypothetical protein
MECIICTHSRMYKHQQSPSWWLPSGPVIPNVTVEHGPGGLCPTQAVSGPHGAPRAASHRRPRDRERGRDGPAWPPCKLRPTASASHVCHTCWRPTRRQRGGREGAGRHHARSASPAEGRIGPTGRLVGSARSAAAERRPSPQRPRNACGLGQARLCVSGNISRLRG